MPCDRKLKPKRPLQQRADEAAVLPTRAPKAQGRAVDLAPEEPAQKRQRSPSRRVTSKKKGV